MQIRNVLIKATGIMSKRLRLRACEDLGVALTKKITANNGKVNIDDVSLFLRDKLGAKKCRDIVFSDNVEQTAEFLTKDFQLPEETAQFVIKGSLSSAAKSPTTGRALLDLRVQSMEAADAINTTVHETQHLLYRTTSFKMKMSYLLAKIFPKRTQKIVEKYADVLNEKNMMLQQYSLMLLGIDSAVSNGVFKENAINTILKQTECKNIKELREFLRNLIRKKILLFDCDKRNAKILKTLSECLKDEANSYTVGSKAQKIYLASTGTEIQGATYSETLARLYEETIPVLKSEARKQRVNNIKKFFGIKPKEYGPVIEERCLSKEELFELYKDGIYSKEEYEQVLRILGE